LPDSKSVLLNTRKAARFLGRRPGTLTVWRSTRAVEIPYVKMGRSVMYRLSDLEAFVERQTVRGDGRQRVESSSLE